MALKTNSRKAVSNLKAYIINASTDILTDRNGYGYSEEAVKANIYKCINEVFEEEFVKHNLEYKTGRITREELFIKWGEGLTCGALFDFWLSKAVDTLGDILEETEEERNRYNEDEAAVMLSRLIYREVVRGCKA